MTTSERESLRAASIVSLPAPKRYAFFVKRAADCGVVWGLWGDGGWVLGAEGGELRFPMWPEPSFASECAIGDWAKHAPKAIGLSELPDLLGKLDNKHIEIAAFPTPNGKGIFRSTDQLLSDLADEIRNISGS